MIQTQRAPEARPEHRSTGVFRIACLLLAAVAGTAWVGLGATEVLEIVVEGVGRTALVHVPESLPSDAAVPLVIAFHGSALNGEIMEQMTGFSTLAKQERFIAVYPNGTGPADVLSWNARTCCSVALERNVDDLAFVDALLNELIAKYPVDPNRVYATGFSNGGMLTYILAIERPERFAAIAVVSGAMFATQEPPGVAMPVMIIHGTNDTVLPYHGGWGALRNLSGKTEPALPVADAASFWIENNGCASISPITTSERNAEIKAFTECRDGSDVILITLLGGDHTWPVIARNPSSFLLSDDAYDLYASLSDEKLGDIIPWELFEVGIDTSRSVWAFFEEHGG